MIERFQKYKRSRTSYLEKIPQNINKHNNFITLYNQIITMKGDLSKLVKYLHEIKKVSKKSTELSTGKNEIK